MNRNRVLGCATAVVLAAIALQGLAPSPAVAVETEYSVRLTRGASKTVFGQTFRFTGNGTLTVDTDTGIFTYSIALSNGLTFEGTGQVAQTVKNEVFGTGTTTSAGGIAGNVILTGKLKRKGAKFAAGKLYAAIPNRLGPAPDGFVYTTARLSGKRQ